MANENSNCRAQCVPRTYSTKLFGHNKEQKQTHCPSSQATLPQDPIVKDKNSILSIANREVMRRIYLRKNHKSVQGKNKEIHKITGENCSSYIKILFLADMIRGHLSNVNVMATKDFQKIMTLINSFRHFWSKFRMVKVEQLFIFKKELL